MGRGKRQTPAVPISAASAHSSRTAGPRSALEREARACGLELIGISSRYENLVVADEAGPGTLAIAGLVARQRRFLQAVCVLADQGYYLEAMALVRTMIEFLIRQRWLELDSELNYTLWALEDVRRKLTLERELQAVAIQVMEPEMKGALQDQEAHFVSQLDEIKTARGLQKRPSMPSLQDQSKALGHKLVYSMSYRFDSQVAVHPSPWALEQLFEEHPRGVKILAEPPEDRSPVDPYSVSALVLQESLLHAASGNPDFELDGLGDVSERILGLRQQLEDDQDNQTP